MFFIDDANNRPYKLEFSTLCLINKLWRASLFNVSVWKKNCFWQTWSGCEEIQICILHIFKKKMPFEISSSKKSYFWTRTVHTNQLLGFVLIVTFENSNFSWKCESKKIFIYMSLKNLYSLSFWHSLLL